MPVKVFSENCREVICNENSNEDEDFERLIMTYITLPSVPILEKASESPLNILDLIRGKILRNKIDDDHRLFLQGYSAIQIIKAASLKVCSLPDNRRHPVARACLVIIMLDVCGPQISLQVVSDQLGGCGSFLWRFYKEPTVSRQFLSQTNCSNVLQQRESGVGED